MAQFPMMETPCRACKHPYAEHYTTYGGKTQGCGHENREPYMNSPVDYDIKKCTCVGFAATIFTPPVSPLAERSL